MFAARTFSRLGGSLSRTATVNNVATKFRVALPTIRFMSEMAETPEGEEVRPPQVYVGNLPFALDEDQLKAMVADKIGDSFSHLKIATDRNTGRSRGFGYITFEEPAGAENAVEQLTGLEIEGRAIRFDISKPRDPNAPREQRRGTGTNSENSLFVANIDHSVTTEDMVMMCNEVLGEGKITKVRIALDRDTGRPRGFGHIEFISKEEALDAMEKLSSVDFFGRTLRVDKAYALGERPPRVNSVNRENSIFVGNLDFGVTDVLLKEMLDELIGPGSWVNVRLASDRETGRSRGFGHIDFKDKSLAEHAVSTLDGMDLMGRKIRVDFAGNGRRRESPAQSSEDGLGSW